MYIIGIAYTQNKPENLLWSLPLLIISISVIFCVFVFKPAINKTWSSWPEKINGDKIGNPNSKFIPQEEFFAKKDKLKWSNSMGPFTWERVQEIIEKKNKNWRFPIREELKGRYFFRTHNYDSKYWMADQRIFSEAYSKETVAGRGVKAYLYLVREV